MDAGSLKNKVATSIVTMSSIHLLKVFMNEATERGVNINLAYKSKHFVKPTEKSEQIYLNENELKNILEQEYIDENLQ